MNTAFLSSDGVTRSVGRGAIAALIVLASSAGLAGGQQAATKHHSKMKGAVAGAVAGHAMGGHAKAGAVAGALIQHHRNHAAKAKAP